AGQRCVLVDLGGLPRERGTRGNAPVGHRSPAATDGLLRAASKRPYPGHVACKPLGGRRRSGAGAPKRRTTSRSRAEVLSGASPATCGGISRRAPRGLRRGTGGPGRTRVFARLTPAA